MSQSSRRTFLKTSAAAGALGLSTKAYSRAAGANERIRIGVIGLGTRGYGTHIPSIRQHAKSLNAQVAAVCDVWSRPLRGASDKVEEWFGEKPATMSDYRQMLTMKDIDAVMIATPDFQHATMLKHVADAGKDCYAEKPLAMHMAELRDAVDAVKRSSIVCQVGTQRRSDPHHRGCASIYKTGVLGHVGRIEQLHNRNRPNWYIRLPRLKQMKQEDVDWRSFLLHRDNRPFNPLSVVGWYGYREFCTGSIGQFMSHFIDQVHMITGAKLPRSAVAQGGTFTWKDPKHKFDCPDHVQTTLVYPEDFMVHFSTNFGNAAGRGTRFYGNRGVLNLDNERKPTITGEGVFDKSAAAKEQEVKPEACPDHFLDWLQCLRTRRTPSASIDAGYQHAVACIMSDTAYATGKRQVYDAEQREIRAG